MQICLTAKELICIAAAMGVSEIIGINDEFKAVAPRKLQRKLDQVRQSLETKGIIISDFEGNSSLNTAYLILWKTMFGSEKIVALDAQLLKSGQKSVLFYIADNNAVEAVRDNNSYTLNLLDYDECKRRILSCVDWVPSPAVLDRGECSVKQSTLRKLKSPLNIRSGREGLVKAGITDTVADLVFDAFSFKSNFYSFAFIDMTDDGKLDSLMFIDDVKGAVQLVSTIEDDENYVGFVPTTQAQISEALIKLVETPVLRKVSVM